MSTIEPRATALNVVVLPSIIEEESERVFAALDNEVAKCRELHQGRLAGFALMVWTADGDGGAALQYGATSPFPVALVPSFAADAVREAMTAARIARAVDDDSCVGA